MVLLEDEQNLLRWLSQYGPLPRKQIRKLLIPCNERVAEKIINNLKRGHYIEAIDGGRYFGTDKYCRRDYRTILALWVLTKFIEQSGPLVHFPADAPGQVFFLMDGVGYEIIVLYQDEEHLMRTLQVQGDTRYIIVLPDMAMADRIQLPAAPCLLATIDFTDSDEPQITFYSQEES